MQNRPNNWIELFNSAHRTEYLYTINGVEYSDANIQGVPVIKKPLMQEPTIGKCCIGSLTMLIRPQDGVEIPKAAPVVVRCRLSSRDGQLKTDWIYLGHFWISQRRNEGALIELTCRDAMMLAGRSYTDKTEFTVWPVRMSLVVSEIAALMGVEIDARTKIIDSDQYMVDYPNEDVLMSEILSMIAAAHGGVFVITETNCLRLIPFPGTSDSVQDVGGKYTDYTPYSTGIKTVSRLTLTDMADNQFTVGDDSGIELAASCDYATQRIVNNTASGAYLDGTTLFLSSGNLHNGSLTPYPAALLGGGMLYTYGSLELGSLSVFDGRIDNGTLFLPSDAALDGGTLDVSAKGLLGKSFRPYSLKGAYLDPAVELGDTVTIAYKGQELSLILASIDARLSPYFSCDTFNGVEDDDEDEYPYISASDLQAKRYVSTSKSYFGNRINRKEGFVSELVVDGASVARLIANASTFTMQRQINGAWEDCIFFDSAKQKYVLTGEVEVIGAITSTDLSTSGKTTINGDNITTGVLNTQLIKIEGSDNFQWDKEFIVAKDPSNTDNQIRIGRYDGQNYGIGFTRDGGESWSVAVGFDGTHINQDDKYSGVSVTNNSLVFAADANGKVKAETHICKVVAYTGDTPVLPVVASITGMPAGMSAVIGSESDKAVPITISTTAGATLGSEESADGVLTINVTSPVVMSLNINWCKVNTGVPGTSGTSGYSRAVIQLYQRAASAPALPSGECGYTFATGELSGGGLGNWTQSIPTGTDPCFMTSATAVSQNATVTIPQTAWSQASKIAESGEDGYNIATVYLYKRSETIPATPTKATTFTFVTASLTGELDGWTQAIPTTNGAACWVTSTQAVGKTSTVSIEAGAWIEAAKLVEDGEAGAKTYHQDEPPSNPRLQDLWIDSNDSNKLYRYDGTQWVDIQDLHIPDIIEQLVAQTTTLDILSGSIEGKVSETYVNNQVESLVTSFNSTLTQTARDLQAQFESTAQDAAGNVDTKYSMLIRASGDGVEIGRSDSPFRTLLTNNRLSFLQYDGDSATEVAYISNKKLYITDAQITNELAIGTAGGNTFVFQKTPEGLSLRYVSAVDAISA